MDKQRKQNQQGNQNTLKEGKQEIKAFHKEENKTTKSKSLHNGRKTKTR